MYSYPNVDMSKAMLGRPCPECGERHTGMARGRMDLAGVLHLWCSNTNQWFLAPAYHDKTAEIEKLMDAQATSSLLRKRNGIWKSASARLIA